MAGKHYTFMFESIDGFELNAKLDYFPLQKENLDYLSLNITNIEKSSELKNMLKKIAI